MRFFPVAAAIFIVSLAVRLVHLFQIRQAPFFTLLMGDAQSYHAWAQRIAAGDWIGSEVFYQAPLYPYFLAFIYALLGEAPLTVRLCQAVVGSLACVWLAIAAWRLFSWPAGLAAGLMLAFYAPAIFFDGVIQKSVLDACLLCLALMLLSGLVVNPSSPRRWLWVGVTLGGLTLSRENAVVFVAAILLRLLWQHHPRGALPHTPARSLAPFDSRSGRPELRRGAGAPTPRAAPSRARRRRAVVFRLAPAGYLLTGLAIVLLPVAARNKVVSGEFHLTTSQFGPNFYIGNNESASGTYQPLRFGHGDAKYERQDARELAEQSMGRQLTPAEVSRYWTRRTLEYIWTKPGDWLELMGRKIMLAWNAAEVADTEDQISYADWSVVLRVASRVWHFGILAPLALLGIWVTWPRRSELALLYLLPAAYVLALIAFAVMARYRYPLVPFLILFASAGVANVSRLRRAPLRQLVSGLAAAILFAVFCNWPVYSMAEMRAITEGNVGTELQAQGKLDEAIALYRAALARDPNDAVTRSNLGAALASKGRLDEAIVQYRAALVRAPNDADARYNLGNALEAQGKHADAADQFREALRIEPRFADAHLNMGNALVALGQTAEAVDHYQRALEIDPDFAEAHSNLGSTLRETGDLAEALTHFRRAVQLLPQSANAHNDLGVVLAQQNQLDDAIGHFREAIRLEPKHAEAHGNLEMALQMRSSTGLSAPRTRP